MQVALCATIVRVAAVSVIATKMCGYPISRIDVLDGEPLADFERHVAVQSFPPFT